MILYMGEVAVMIMRANTFMVVVMGIIVLSIVLAILLPIFELNAIVR